MKSFSLFVIQLFYLLASVNAHAFVYTAALYENENHHSVLLLGDWHVSLTPIKERNFYSTELERVLEARDMGLVARFIEDLKIHSKSVRFHVEGSDRKRQEQLTTLGSKAREDGLLPSVIFQDRSFQNDKGILEFVDVDFRTRSIGRLAYSDIFLKNPGEVLLHVFKDDSVDHTNVQEYLNWIDGLMIESEEAKKTFFYIYQKSCNHLAKTLAERIPGNYQVFQLNLDLLTLASHATRLAETLRPNSVEKQLLLKVRDELVNQTQMLISETYENILKRKGNTSQARNETEFRGASTVVSSQLVLSTGSHTSVEALLEAANTPILEAVFSWVHVHEKIGAFYKSSYFENIGRILSSSMDISVLGNLIQARVEGTNSVFLLGFGHTEVLAKYLENLGYKQKQLEGVQPNYSPCYGAHATSEVFTAEQLNSIFEAFMNSGALTLQSGPSKN